MFAGSRISEATILGGEKKKPNKQLISKSETNLMAFCCSVPEKKNGAVAHANDPAFVRLLPSFNKKKSIHS